MKRYSIRPATTEDFVLFKGNAPQHTCRAWTVIYDDDIACIAGVTINRDNLVFFSEMNTEHDYPPSAIFKVACYIVEEVSKMGMPVVAQGEPESRNFLERLGFIHTGNYEGQELYQLWQPQH